MTELPLWPVWIALIFLGISPSGNTLQCFVCNSAFDENCDSKSPPLKYLVECSYLTAQPYSHDGVSISIKQNATTAKKITNRKIDYNEDRKEFYGTDEQFGQNLTLSTYSSCRKQDVTIPEQVNAGHIKPESRRIVRSCGWLGYRKKDICKVISREEILSLHCSCHENGCNGAQRLGLDMTITISGNFFLLLVSWGHFFARI